MGTLYSLLLFCKSETALTNKVHLSKKYTLFDETQKLVILKTKNEQGFE